jgi:hypothetical protein
MFPKYFSLAIILICCISVNVDPGYAQTHKDYEDIYIVIPPKRQDKSGTFEGGTFYVIKSEDGKTFPPEGYLPTMALIKVSRNKDGKLIKEKVPEEFGRKCWYCKFTGSDGSDGYIKENSIRPLTEFFRGRDQFLPESNSPPESESEWQLIIPIHPTEKVSILNPLKPTEVVYDFSRSVPEVVLTCGDKVEITVNEEDVGYYKLKFFKNTKDGEDGLVEVGKLNKTYRISPLNPRSFKEIKKIEQSSQGDGFYNTVKEFVKIFQDEEDAINKLNKLYIKSCNDIIEIGIKFELSGPFKVVNVSGTNKIVFGSGKRYTFERYKGFFADKEVDVMKEITCVGSSNNQHYAEMLIVKGMGKSANPPFQIFRSELIDKYDSYFKKPNTTGTLEKREKMVALKPMPLT